MLSSPRITVVIPTRERHEVLAKALLTVTRQDYDALEILVSDNFSSDSTEDVVRSVGDERVRYVNTGARLSMSHNWEFALSHVKEGWVTIMGDDDGLLPGSVRRVAELAASTEVEALRSAVCSYSWPSLLGRDNGYLVVPLRRGIRIRNSRLWLGKVLRGRASYLDLPMLYTGGYVRTRVLERIRRTTRSVYLSRIPDVYSAIAIASVTDRYLYVHEPLAINGASRHSTGTSQFSKGQTAASPVRVFESEPNISFHADVPLCADGSSPPSLQALVYESFLQSAPLRDAAAPDIAPQQLELILAEPGLHESSLNDWGQLFAQRHGLDFARIVRKAAARRRLRRVQRLPRRLVDYLNSYSVDTADDPIRDVFEASKAAAAVRAARPSRWRKAAALVGRVARAPVMR
jgi:hypothetical protein